MIQPDIVMGSEQAGVDERRGPVVVTSMSSDSHTWNLVFLQLLIEELGYDVVNLGPCVPDDVLVDRCMAVAPSMVVISSVNGHGHQDGLRVIDKVRARQQLVATPVVIGGKLGVSDQHTAERIEQLMAAGFDAVFDDSGRGISDFLTFAGSIPAVDTGAGVEVSA